MRVTGLGAGARTGIVLAIAAALIATAFGGIKAFCLVAGAAALLGAAIAVARSLARRERTWSHLRRREPRRSLGIGVGTAAGAIALIIGLAVPAAASPGLIPAQTAAASVDAGADTTPPPGTAATPDADPGDLASEAPADASADATLPGTRSGTALALLATIAVKGPAPQTGYERTAKFGEAWLDVEGNGCRTREDILARDLVDIVREGCKVMTGTLDDPYTGDVIHFRRGNDTSALVQIDHVVALVDAWRTGAQQLSQEDRVRLANDPLNLLAVDGAANQQKSGSNAASWLPANKAFRCEYVARQISVKAAYGLWVVAPEKAMMEQILAACPDQPAIERDDAAWPPAVTAAPEPTGGGTFAAPASGELYYENCAAARAAGAVDIRTGEPGYRTGLDGDLDGIACES